MLVPSILSRVLTLTLLLTMSGGVPATPAAPPDGTLAIGVHVTLVSRWLDPGETEALITPFMVLYTLHDALLKPMPGNISAPSLAESWTLAKDGVTYEFVLRKNAKFHNGDPVTAEDVKFTFERYKGSGAKLLKDKVKEIQTPAPNRVRFVMKEPWPDFIAFYGTSATGAGWIVPKKYIERVGEDAYKKAPVGAGPFKFAAFTPGIELTLDAFPDYWRKAPQVKRLVMRSIPDETTRAAAVKTGEVDLAYLFGGTIAADLQRTPGIRVVAPLLYGVYWLDFLDQWDPKSPWHDRRVRQAASLAIDRNAINQAEMLGLGKAGGAFVPPEFDFALKMEPLPFDPKRAKQLLVEAGFPNGFDAGDLTPLPPYTSLGEAVGGYPPGHRHPHVGAHDGAGHLHDHLAGEEDPRAAHRRHRRGGQRGRAARAVLHQERHLRLRHPAGDRRSLPAAGQRAGSRQARGAAAPDPEDRRRSGAGRPHLPAGLPLGRGRARRGAGGGADPGLPVRRAGRGPPAQVGVVSCG